MVAVSNASTWPGAEVRDQHRAVSGGNWPVSGSRWPDADRCLSERYAADIGRAAEPAAQRVGEVEHGGLLVVFERHERVPSVRGDHHLDGTGGQNAEVRAAGCGEG